MCETLALALATRRAKTVAQTLIVDLLGGLTVPLERGRVPQRAFGFVWCRKKLLAGKVSGIAQLAMAIIHPAS